MQKLAGILDSVQSTLPPAIWGPDQKMLPQVRQAIIDRIRTKFSMDKIKEIIIIGSITGYKYSETSDVDVNIGVEIPQDVDMKLKTHVVKEINGVSAPGSRHPINFFVQRWYPEMKEGFEDIAFGAYDVLQDKWLAPPPKKESFRDPKQQFSNEIRVAQHLVRAFNKKAQDYKNQLSLLDSEQEDQKKKKIASSALRILRNIFELVNQVEDGRKFSYSYGWGIPRTGFRNIIYKTFENGPHGDLFHQLVEMDNDTHITDLIKVANLSNTITHGEQPYHIVQEKGNIILALSKDRAADGYMLIDKSSGKSRMIDEETARQFLNKNHKTVR